MLFETLESVLSRDRIGAVLDASGWSTEDDGPSDAKLSVTELLTGPLRALLAEVLDPEVAAFLVEELASTLPNDATGQEEAPDLEPEAGPPRSGVRRRLARPRETLVPRGSAGLIALSQDPSVAPALAAVLPSANIIAVANVQALVAELTDLRARVVVLDRRGKHDCDLIELEPSVLIGCTVIVWGWRRAYAPELERALCMATRRIDCTPDATASDVATLCSALGGGAGGGTARKIA